MLKQNAFLVVKINSKIWYEACLQQFSAQNKKQHVLSIKVEPAKGWEKSSKFHFYGYHLPPLQLAGKQGWRSFYGGGKHIKLFSKKAKNWFLRGKNQSQRKTRQKTVARVLE